MSRIIAIVMVVIIAALGALCVYLKTSYDVVAGEAADLRSDLADVRKTSENNDTQYLAALTGKNDEIGALKTKITNQEGQLGKIPELTASLEAATQKATTDAEEVTRLSGQVQSLTAERDRALQQVQLLTGDKDELLQEFTGAKNTINDLTARNTALELDKDTLQQNLSDALGQVEQLERQKKEMQGLAPHLTDTQITGTIEEELESGRVVIGGLSQTPEVNLELSVLQEGEFIGRVRVDRAFEHYAGARITYLLPGKTMKAGDKVRTGFPDRSAP